MQQKRLDLLALMPCPLKVALEKEISIVIKEINSDYKTSLTCRIVSNAVAQEEIFNEIALCKSLEDLPNLMIAPGFSRFFYHDFTKNFRRAGCFESIAGPAPAKVFRELKIMDPEGYYDILAFNPLVFLVDKTKDRELATPLRWSDLTRSEYRRKVAYRGHNDREFCEGILLNVYKEMGIEGIRKLGESVKCRLHPAQMAKYAGSKSEAAPSVSVIPYSFACMARPNKHVEIVWPEDGAIVNPLVMLVKKDCTPAVKKLAMELSATKIGSIFSKGGFYPLCPGDMENLESRSFKWLGWEFITNNNLHSLLKDLNQTMLEIVHNSEGSKANDKFTGSRKEGGGSCS